MPSQSDQSDDAAALYMRGVQLSHKQGCSEEAERVFASAVAAYRRLQRAGDDPEAMKARRGLARTLWRYSMQLIVCGRRMEAMAPGREGVAIFRAVLDAAPPGDTASDELVGELATAMNDLSQAAVRAEFRDEHQALMRDVVELCEGRPGPLARQALGTALHNQMVAEYDRVFLGVPRPPRDSVSAIIDLANRTVQLRSELADWARPVTKWELANSRRLRGAILCSAAMGERGIADLLAAWEISSQLSGPALAGLRDQIAFNMYWAAARYPQIAASVDWPTMPGEMDDDDFARFAVSAVREYFEKNNSLMTKYAFKGPVLWMYDRSASTLKFFDNGKLHSTCDVIEIGSFSHSNRSWKWGWSDDAIPQRSRERALPLKKLQRITGKKYFGSEGQFPVSDEAMAGKLAAISVRQLSALGHYSAEISDGSTASLALVDIQVETGTSREMDDNDFARFAESAVKELKEKDNDLESKYRFDLSARWECDLYAALPIIKFFDRNDKLHLTCEVIEIGTYSPPTQSWKWGWSNDSIPPKMRERALPLKQLQQITGKDYFGFEGPFSADDLMAWELAAISVRHLSALGCYAAKYHDGRLFVFLAYVNVHAES